MGTAGLADFDLLEKKITQAAEFIERLKSEKKQVEDANNELKEELRSIYIKNEELTKELKAVKKENKGKKDLEKTREELNSKIDGMLAKLEEIDI
jgi:FtsZ-binding cell division protein ZapB